MKSKSIISATCACLLSLATSHALGSVIYTYTGNHFNYYSGWATSAVPVSVNVSFQLAEPLESKLTNAHLSPDRFVFVDGVTRITQADAFDVEFIVSTDQIGRLSAWSVKASKELAFNEWTGTTNARMSSIAFGTYQLDFTYRDECPRFYGLCTVTDLADVYDQPGLWTMTVVPVPTTVWLFGSGLIGLIVGARTKVRI